MDIESFDDLLRAARAQPEPQRLLFVFAAAELPEDCTPQQRARFDAGGGGTLVPLMSVDKDPGELADFAGLSGRGGRAPSAEEADRSLQRMIESVKTGAFSACIPFDRRGRPLQFG